MNPTLPLKDIHLPEAISWWPPAIGWWLLAILLPLLIAGLVWSARWLTRKTAVKTAKKQLLALKRNTDLNERQKLAELSALLRRVAISTVPREQSAGLTGAAWLKFLDRPLPGAPFSQGAGRLLATAPYQPHPPSGDDIEQLLQLAETWLKHCHKLKLPPS